MNEIYEALASYKDAIDLILQKLDVAEKRNKELEERLAYTEDFLQNEIVGPAQKAMEDYDKEQRFTSFNDKYGEKLSHYNDSLKPIEGEDFDLVKVAFDGMDGTGEDFDTDTYVDTLVSQVEKQLSDIKKALGLPEDTPVEVKQDEDGEVSVVVEDVVAGKEPTETEEVKEEVEVSAEPAEADEAPIEEEVDEDGTGDEPVETDEEEPTDSPEDVEAFEKELEGLLKK